MASSFLLGRARGSPTDHSQTTYHPARLRQPRADPVRAVLDTGSRDRLARVSTRASWRHLSSNGETIVRASPRSLPWTISDPLDVTIRLIASSCFRPGGEAA